MEANTNDIKRKGWNSPVLNKMAYGGFLLLGLFFLIVKGNFSNSTLYVGLALVFDPFDQSVKWKMRPLYQKAWLVLHLLVLFGTFGAMIIGPSLK